MYNELIVLVDETITVNEYGDIVKNTTERPVFAKLMSITQSEFYQAQAAGLKPEVKFALKDYLDYRNEKIVKYKPYNGETEEYSVIRTYRNNNELEITCKRGVDVE